MVDDRPPKRERRGRPPAIEKPWIAGVWPLSTSDRCANCRAVATFAVLVKRVDAPFTPIRMCTACKDTAEESCALRFKSGKRNREHATQTQRERRAKKHNG
jgi:hypothetical protein